MSIIFIHFWETNDVRDCEIVRIAGAFHRRTGASGGRICGKMHRCNRNFALLVVGE